MTMTEMLAAYRALTAADSYTVGFVCDGRLYRVDTPEIPEGWMKLDRASTRKGGMQKLRLRMSAAIRRQLVADGTAQLVGGADLLKDTRYNRGERWEQLVTEAAGQVWAKDSTPFWVAGDLHITGRGEVQVKLDQAEITNEKALARAAALA